MRSIASSGDSREGMRAGPTRIREDTSRSETARRCDCLPVVKANMLLADYAVVSDGKLTIVGGGWSQTGPEPASFGIGLLIQVPWDQANTRHSFSVELLDSDGTPVGFESDEDSDQVVAFGGEFEVGRPPGPTPGHT